MPGAELLDEVGIPLLVDAYPYDERYISFQLYQRGTRWTTLQRGLQNTLHYAPPARAVRRVAARYRRSRHPQRAAGARADREARPTRASATSTSTRPTSTTPRTTTATAPHSSPRSGAGRARRPHLDGHPADRPLASETALVLVSDHGTNTDERVYSQGYNLVKFLGRATGGGHHVVTKRRLLSDYALKGIYPLIPLIYTTTEDSFYLKGQSNVIPDGARGLRRQRARRHPPPRQRPQPAAHPPAPAQARRPVAPAAGAPRPTRSSRPSNGAAPAGSRRSSR